MSIRLHLEILAQDVRYGVRALLRSPTFSSLPYPDDGRLVSVGMTAPLAPEEFLLGYDYLDWRAAQTPFASIGAWSGVGDCDLTDANPVRVRCGRVNADLLPTLGIRPFLGHAFTRQRISPMPQRWP
jgi:hypothetical protein